MQLPERKNAMTEEKIVQCKI